MENFISHQASSPTSSITETSKCSLRDFKSSIISPVHQNIQVMGIHLPMISQAKQILRRSLQASAPSANVPKGHFAVYVGENQKKRFVVPLSYLNHPSFQGLLSQAEEEFGFDHPMGGLTIPCKEDDFINLTCHLNSSRRIESIHLSIVNTDS